MKRTCIAPSVLPRACADSEISATECEVTRHLRSSVAPKSVRRTAYATHLVTLNAILIGTLNPSCLLA